MKRRILSIIFVLGLFVLGIPLLYMWAAITGGSDTQYWQIKNAGLMMVVQDTAQIERYTATDVRKGLDTTKVLSALLYFDTEFCEKPANFPSTLSAARKPGYMGNPQKILSFKMLGSEFTNTDYQNVSQYFTNDSCSRINELLRENILLFKNQHGDIGFHPQWAYLFNSLDHLVYSFNQDNTRFDEFGDPNRYLKFKIDENLFRRFGSVFKIKMILELSDKTITRTFFFRMK